MINRTLQTPTSSRLADDQLLELPPDMKYGSLQPYWHCTISRRARGVYDVRCTWGGKDAAYYGRLSTLKRMIRDHITQHEKDRDAPCRLAEDLRGSQNGEE